MNVEIWSDVMCPYCYLGKKQFEIALNQFEGKDDVSITWRSFELNPDIVFDENNDLYSYLSKIKGMNRTDIENNFNRLAEQGKIMNIDLKQHSKIMQISMHYGLNHLLNYLLQSTLLIHQQ